MRGLRPALVCLAAAASIGGFAAQPLAEEARGAPSLASTNGYRTAQQTPAKIGTASWYGHPYHGRVAASGERYDMRALTAAHPSLPFGTRVRVTNLANGRRVVVRINDRGPFVGSRMVDLSAAAAERLDMLTSGLAVVALEVLG